MNDSTFKPLIEQLADGGYHSGEALGVALGVSRAAIWKRLQALTQLGVVVESVKGLGYRVPGGFSLLDVERILSFSSTSAQEYLGKLYCFDEIHSTNRYLMDEPSHKGDVCIAERQSSGHGRRGRGWFSPFGKNLYLSVCWHFSQGVSTLDGLSLAVGVVLAEVIAELGISGVSLKWPNDLLLDVRGCESKKLGGVLIEVGGDLTGDCKVVIGIGLNVSMSDVIGDEDRQHISQPWCDLKMAGYDGNRNRLIGVLLSKLLPALQNYSESGFHGYRERWLELCAYKGKEVILRLSDRVESGVFNGVDESGALLLEGSQGMQVFNGGEVSLRICAGDY